MSKNNYFTGIEYFEKGQRLFVKYIIGDDPDKVLELIDPEKGLYEFRANSLACVEGLHPNGKTTKHLRFVRKMRPLDLNTNLMFWPKLRVALQFLNDEGKGPQKVHVPGGFEKAIGYTDELLVPDYGLAGSYGWIVPKKDKSKILNSLPPLEDSGEIQSLWIGFYRNSETDWDCFREEPTSEEAEAFSVVYKVDFDQRSFVVKGINSQYEQLSELWYWEGGVVRKGKPLPRSLRPVNL